MTSKQLFSQTMPFVWAKLALGGALVVISALLLAILVGLGSLFGGGGTAITFLIWLSAVGVLRFVIMHYAGYLVKAGHIAVIAEACVTGRVPADQVNYGKEAVKERFVTSNIYFAVDKLVNGAVKQIQNGIGKVGSAMDFIPGMNAVSGAAKLFVSIALGYIDECCLGWTFYNKQQGAFKSAADGVVIYAQNWKTLLKDAAKTMLKVILGVVVVALVIFVPIGLLFKLFHWSGTYAFLLACLVAWVVKFAFMDSYVMVQMMTSYMGVAPQTVVTFDLAAKLSGISASFKELWSKGQAEAPVDEATAPVAAVQASPISTVAPTQTQAPLAAEEHCKTCGMPLAEGAKFCPGCGTPAAPTKTVCPGCGAELPFGTKFCGQCGAQL